MFQIAEAGDAASHKEQLGSQRTLSSSSSSTSTESIEYEQRHKHDEPPIVDSAFALESSEQAERQAPQAIASSKIEHLLGQTAAATAAAPTPTPTTTTTAADSTSTFVSEVEYPATRPVRDLVSVVFVFACQQLGFSLCTLTIFH